MKIHEANSAIEETPDNTTTVESMGIPFIIRKEKAGDHDVIGEVVTGDCYRMEKYIRGMRDAEFYPRVILDIGSHIGTFTALVHKSFPDAIYICVEPNKRSFSLLINNVPFAYCFNAACTYEPVSLLTDDKHNATGGGFMTTPEKFATDELNHKDNFIYKIGEENVETITVEDILKIVGVDKIDILKLDCEGGEFSIMLNMDRRTARGVKLCVGEYHTVRGGEYFKEIARDTFPQLDFEIGGRTPIDHFHSTFKV